MIYPGADEIGCTLFARIFCDTKRHAPDIFVRYSSTLGPYCIPKYEDRTLNESVKHHITAAGAHIVDYSPSADVILMVHSAAVGPSQMSEATVPYHQRHRSYFSEVNIREFTQALRRFIRDGRLVALADVALPNGGDHSLMKLLAKTGLLHGISAYAGWNTSGNSLGTAIAHAVIESYYRKQRSDDAKRRKKSREFYYCRLVEDWGYQAVVRQDVVEHDLPRLNAGYFHVSHVQKEVEAIIQTKLDAFAAQYLQPEIGERIAVTDVELPWKRMFEVKFDLRL